MLDSTRFIGQDPRANLIGPTHFIKASRYVGLNFFNILIKRFVFYSQQLFFLDFKIRPNLKAYFPNWSIIMIECYIDPIKLRVFIKYL
jgi:hypothetical protein